SAGDFRRIAIVGEKKWHEWMATAMKPFTSAEVRYYDHSERAAALAWSRGPVH
ncbi:MAG: STAS/SEC14 domain-containing protein, partial [Sphingobacteriales bacterium]